MKLSWESLAFAWLEKNTPCSKEDAITEITKIMPLGVRRHGKKVCCKTRLAKEAIYRVYSKSFCELPDPLPLIIRKKNDRSTGVTARIRELASSKNGLRKDDVKKLKNGNSLFGQLKKSGVLILDGDVYRIKRGNENE